jgi:hypothetical protein
MAEGGCSMPRLPGTGRCRVYDRAGAASEWWLGGERVRRVNGWGRVNGEDPVTRDGRGGDAAISPDPL